MTPEEYAEKAQAFIDKMKACLSSCFPNSPELSDPFVNGEMMRAAAKLTVELTSQNNRQQVGELEVSYRLGLDRTENYLKVEKSQFVIKAVRGKKRPAVIRFEYEHNKRNAPSSHIHVHSDTAGLGIILHTNGKTDASLSQQDLHYPTGGHRFRVCLEDVIQFVIVELGFVPKEGWEKVVEEGREAYRQKQAEAVIRQNHQQAAATLRSLGYSVVGGPGAAIPGPLNDW